MVVTRFAPSPTGYLHVGSARTALYCWLWSKKTQGKFILRIEDTDRVRSTQEAIDVILEGMKWLGMDWDEGPFYQTGRFDRYKEVIQKLLDEGKAYKCTCSKERLDELRAEQQANKQKPRYDGHCRMNPVEEAKQGEYVIRFKTPQEGAVVIPDMVKGEITIQNKELDDLILLRSDGSPTYNLTVVVDDWDMGVTHVLRGDDHINNTPRQIHILQAVGADIPEYGHMPMLLGPDNKKLSKRHGAASVLDYRDQGYLPEALINYLVRLGWSYGDQEIFTQEELKTLFDIHKIQSSPGAINPEKLLWLNQHYLRTLDPKDVATRLTPFLTQLGADIESGPNLEEVVAIQSDRCKTLVDMAEQSLFWFSDEIATDQKAADKHLKNPKTQAISLFVDKLNNLADWTKENIQEALQITLSELDLKMGKVGPLIRIAVSGGTVSPSIDATLYLLGKTRTINRLNNLLEKISG